MNLNKKYLWFSLVFHLIVLIILFSMTFDNTINKSFIVFGPRSSVPTHAYFKPLKVKKNSRNLKVVQNTAFKKKKNIKSLPKKKIQNKKIVKPKQQPQKKLNKKPNPKKNEVKKIQEKKIPEKKQKPIENKVQKEEKESEVKNKEEIIQEEVFTFDLIDTSDPKLHEYQKHIHKAVVALWKPPVGVPKGTEASVTFVVDKKGSVKEFEMIKEPNNLLYKLSIIRVAKKFEFDKCFWGKRFNIVFRQ